MYNDDNGSHITCFDPTQNQKKVPTIVENPLVNFPILRLDMFYMMYIHIYWEFN